jgi:hypothetical protein
LPFFCQATEANVVCCIVLSAPPLLLTAHSIGHSIAPVQSFPRWIDPYFQLRVLQVPRKAFRRQLDWRQDGG